MKSRTTSWSSQRPPEIPERQHLPVSQMSREPRSLYFIRKTVSARFRKSRWWHRRVTIPMSLASRAISTRHRPVWSRCLTTAHSQSWWMRTVISFLLQIRSISDDWCRRLPTMFMHMQNCWKKAWSQTERRSMSLCRPETLEIFWQPSMQRIWDCRSQSWSVHPMRTRYCLISLRQALMIKTESLCWRAHRLWIFWSPAT